MMGLETIRQMNDEAAADAAAKGLRPLLIDFAMDDDNVFENFRRIPHLGSMDVEDYTVVEEFFVDSSGFGERGEAALTMGQFIDRAREIYDGDGGITDLYFAITSAGQFQVYITAYTKDVS